MVFVDSYNKIQFKNEHNITIHLSATVWRFHRLIGVCCSQTNKRLGGTFLDTVLLNYTCIKLTSMTEGWTERRSEQEAFVTTDSVIRHRWKRTGNIKNDYTMLKCLCEPSKRDSNCVCKNDRLSKILTKAKKILCQFMDWKGVK